MYSQFKNERHVLLEWVHHYFQEGADHIILVDNGSDDGFDPSLLQAIPHITLLSTKLRHRQSDVARYVFTQYVENNFTWATNLDMDEFLYARRYPCISDYLRALSVEEPVRKALVVPWKSFGSSGHVAQPPNLVHHFLFRDHDFPLAKNANLVKTLFQPAYYTLKAHIVDPREDGWQHYPHVSMEGRPVKSYQMWPLFDREGLDLDSAELHLNHYQIQSRDFWVRVKMKRGDADHDGWDMIRTLDYFSKRDKNLVVDRELSFKRRLKKPDLLIFLDENQWRVESEWRREYGNKVHTMHFATASPPYDHDGTIARYLSSRVLVVCPGRSENKGQLNFVLSRTRVTGRSVFPIPLEGFMDPSPDVYATDGNGPLVEYRVFYDEKILPLYTEATR